MISLLSIAASSVVSFVVYILKAVFSMLLWFLKLFVKSLKILFCALPLTTVVFFLLIITNIWILVTGTSEILALVPKISGFELVSPSQNTVLSISEALKGWWSENIYSHHGSGAYIPLLFLTIIMFIPVVSVFLCISALSSFGKLLFCLISIDIAIYILRALGQKSFITQFLDRYYFLFPDTGKKHYEKSYEKWLKRHHEEFENDTYEEAPKRDKYDDFYEEPEDEGYDPEFDEGFDEDEFYEDDIDDEDYDEEEDYEEDEDYDDEEDYDAPPVIQMTSFNFFAGCNSRESVEKKYRSLAKLYHPDNMDGDTASLQAINAQYEGAKKMFPR